MGRMVPDTLYYGMERGLTSEYHVIALALATHSVV